MGLELEVLDVQAIVHLLDLSLELIQLFYGCSLGLQCLQLGLNRLDLLGVIADLLANVLENDTKGEYRLLER